MIVCFAVPCLGNLVVACPNTVCLSANPVIVKNFVFHQQVTLLCFYEELKEATLAGEKRPVGVALREAQLWLRDATLTDILSRVQVSYLFECSGSSRDSVLPYMYFVLARSSHLSSSPLTRKLTCRYSSYDGGGFRGELSWQKQIYLLSHTRCGSAASARFLLDHVLLTSFALSWCSRNV